MAIDGFDSIALDVEGSNSNSTAAIQIDVVGNHLHVGLTPSKVFARARPAEAKLQTILDSNGALPGSEFHLGEQRVRASMIVSEYGLNELEDAIVALESQLAALHQDRTDPEQVIAHLVRVKLAALEARRYVFLDEARAANEDREPELEVVTLRASA